MRCVMYRYVFLVGNLTQFISDDFQSKSTVLFLILEFINYTTSHCIYYIRLKMMHCLLIA